jgi:hypothetical protein
MTPPKIISIKKIKSKIFTVDPLTHMLQGQENLEDTGQGAVFTILRPGILTTTNTV